MEIDTDRVTPIAGTSQFSFAHALTDSHHIGAFFDVDETLVRGASIFWVAKEMFIRGIFGIKDLQYAGRQTLRFVLFGENKNKMSQFADRATKLVDGKSVNEFNEIGEDIFKRYFLPNVYRTTFDRLQEHVDAGHQVWLISATPWIIAEIFAKHIGAQGGMGTRTKVNGDLIIGELDGGLLHGPAKVGAVQQIADRENLVLAKSWAYSDSANDIPMLSTVGHPVAVNPDKELEIYAKQNGWEILQARERKDKVKRQIIKTGLAVTCAYVAWFSTKKLLSTVRK